MDVALCIYEIVIFVGLIMVHQGRAFKCLIMMTQVDNQQLCRIHLDSDTHVGRDELADGDLEGVVS